MPEQKEPVRSIATAVSYSVSYSASTPTNQPGANRLDQISGGGEAYEGQPSGLHLIEKTEQEIRFKVGLNF